ncbi:MAG TPA: hypothetical protein VN673_08725 [Clostridia bacterium]|nr:hypothetical protein [Clostridia bacterium]
MKQFLLFTYYANRPLGGVKDYLADFDTLQEALDNILDERGRYYQVVDRTTMKVVKEGLALFKRFDPKQFRRSGPPRRTD